MKLLNDFRITLKLPVIMLALTITSVVIFGLVAERIEKASLTEEAKKRVEAVLTSEMHSIVNYFDQIMFDLSRAARATSTIRAIRGFSAGWEDLGKDAASEVTRVFVTENPYPAGQRDALVQADDQSRFTSVHAIVHGLFREMVKDFGYYDVLLFDTQGNLVYTVLKDADFATNMRTGPFKDSGLARTWSRAMTLDEGGQVFEDFSAYGSEGKPAAFIGQPVFMSGERVGVIAIQLTADRIGAMVSKADGLGASGEINIYGPDLLLRAGGNDTSDAVLTETLDTPELRAALEGKSGTTRSISADGERVIEAYAPLNVAGTNWAATGHVLESAALAGVGELRTMLLLASVGVVGMCGLIGFLFSGTLSRPLGRVTGAIARITDGDLETDIVDAGRGDEIGQIAGNLEKFRETLKEAEDERVKSAFRGAAFSASSAATLMLGSDRRVLHVNQAMIDLLHDHAEAFRSANPAFAPGNVLGAALKDILPSPVESRLHKLVNTDGALPSRFSCAVGDLRLELEVGEVRDACGTAIGHVIEMRDVTATFLSRAVMNSIDANQVRVDFAFGGGIVAANEAFCRAVGQDPDSLQGRDLKEVLTSELGKEEDERILTALRSGEAVFGRFHLQGAGAEKRILEGSLTPVKDADGDLLRNILIASDVTEARGAIEAAEEAQRKAASALRQVVDALRAELSNLSDGDLTVRIETEFADEYEELRQDFNTMAGRLTETISGVAANAHEIRGSVSEITAAADDLSARTERQAATLEETAAALDKLTSSVHAAADGAAEADRIVSTARENAETSGAVVREAVEAMSELSESSKQISKITDVIDDISYQTNLLALNAGVEAARAGEAGRGFAVVASEVRALAQRSSEAAREIKELIAASGGQVERGVDLVGQAGEALKSIVAGVIDISHHVSQIADSSRSQSTGLAEINEAVGQLDQATQQNAAMFEETTAAGHALSKEAESLTSSIARFKTSTSVVSLMGAEPAAKLPKNQPSVTDGGQRAASVSNARAAGGTALAEAPSVEDFEEDDGWSHF